MREGGIVQGKYRVLRLIGDGGMGSVYEAEHEQLGSRVALKFLQGEISRRPGVAERFRREARVSASIQSPHVARVTDVDTAEDGSPFLVMELLEGRSLAQVLAATRAAGRAGVGHERSIDFALQILAGLEAAHGIGVVHRDLKPDNVIVVDGPGGETIKVIDFGIAKLRDTGLTDSHLTHAGTLMGTPEYMAPEQLFSASDVDGRADVYSVGVMLYELLSGERPARGETAAAIIASVQLGEVRPLHEIAPHVSPELSEIVHRALLAERDERMPSAYDFRRALIPFAGSLSHPGQLAATPRRISSAPPAGTEEPVPGTVPPAPHPRRSPRSTTTEPALPTRASSIPAAPEPAEARGPSTVLGGPDPTHMEAVAAPGRSAPLMTGVIAPPQAPTRAPQRAGNSNKILGVLLGLCMTGGIALVVVALGSNRKLSEGPPTAPPLEAPPPVVATAEEHAPANARNSPAPAERAASAPEGRGLAAPASMPAPTHTVPVSAKAPEEKPTVATAKPSDSDAPSEEETGPFGLPLPKSLPPLPSSLPEVSMELPDSLPKNFPSALPSTFPELPKWPTDAQPAETPDENVRRQ